MDCPGSRIGLGGHRLSKNFLACGTINKLASTNPWVAKILMLASLVIDKELSKMQLAQGGLDAGAGDKRYQCLPTNRKGLGERDIFAMWSCERQISHGFSCRPINQSMFTLKVHGP